MFYFWPGDYTWSYQLVRAMAQAQFGGGDIGEMLVTADRMHLGDARSWRDEWLRTADEVGALASGAPASLAAEACLRVSTYLRLAGFFLDPDDPDEHSLYLRAAESFRRGAAGVEAVRIPFEGRSLYGYLALPEGTPSPVPVAILIGGLESTAEEVYFAGGVAAVRCGFACLVLEGPGQGGTLRLAGIPSRADYERPIAAAIDYLETRPELDASRVGLIGYSLGGYYASRASAFERRLRACVVWGAEYDYAEVWHARPADHPLVPRLLHTLGAASLEAALRILRDFNLRGVAERIGCPLLILHGEEDVQVPVSHATRTFDAARCQKRLKLYSAGQPGSIHCQWDVPRRAHQEMFSWLEEHLA